MVPAPHKKTKTFFLFVVRIKNQAGNRGVICGKSRILPRRGEFARLSRRRCCAGVSESVFTLFISHLARFGGRFHTFPVNFFFCASLRGGRRAHVRVCGGEVSDAARSVSGWTFPRACATVRFLCGACACVNTQTRNRVITKACFQHRACRVGMNGLGGDARHRPLPAGQQLCFYCFSHRTVHEFYPQIF